jgi:hypothetical protein
MAHKILCAQCKEDFLAQNKSRKFCSRKCELEYKYNDRIQKWLSGEISGGKGEGYGKLASWAIRYLLEKAKYKCEKCGFNKAHPRTGKTILETHHKDENPNNSRPENIIILCPNCHSLADSKNNAKGTGRRYYKQQYYKDMEVR